MGLLFMNVMQQVFMVAMKAALELFNWVAIAIVFALSAITGAVMSIAGL